MKSLSLMIPALLGVLVVLQAGLNRKISQAWGLPTAVLMNAIVLLCCATVMFFYAKQNQSDLLDIHFDLSKFNWWYLLPGVFGLTLVFGTPFAISKWGATHTFIIIVSAQLMTSLLWDIMVESKEISWPRIAGCGLAWLGVFLANS